MNYQCKQCLEEKKALQSQIDDLKALLKSREILLNENDSDESNFPIESQDYTERQKEIKFFGFEVSREWRKGKG